MRAPLPGKYGLHRLRKIQLAGAQRNRQQGTGCQQQQAAQQKEPALAQATFVGTVNVFYAHGLDSGLGNWIRKISTRKRHVNELLEIFAVQGLGVERRGVLGVHPARHVGNGD